MKIRQRGTKLAKDRQEARLRHRLALGDQRFQIAPLYKLHRDKKKPVTLPDVKDPEGRISHALELSARDLNPIVLYVDPDSGLIRKRMYTADAPGRPVIEEEFSDYRPIDGIQIAFRATQKVGPLSVERRVIDVKVNAPIDAALFQRPAS